MNRPVSPSPPQLVPPDSSAIAAVGIRSMATDDTLMRAEIAVLDTVH